jgi:enoyl-CoA hydratase
MAEEQILRSEHGGALILRFNRPRKLNAITLEMIRGLQQAVTDLECRSDLRALVITSFGQYFSSGIDVVESFPREGDNVTPSEVRRRGKEFRLLCDQLEAVEKPVIVSAQGPCWGAALELALSCDFRFASESATFALPEVKWGLVPSSGGTSRLTRLVGTGWARWLTMAGQTVTAADARLMGLVHEVQPADELAARVSAFVADLSALPSEAVGLAKLTIGICEDLGGDRGRDVERITSSLMTSSSEYLQKLREFE